MAVGEDRDKSKLTVATSSIEQLNDLADAYRTGDRKIRSAINKALKKVSLPLADEIPEEASKVLPRRGGLAERIRDAQGSISPSLRAARPSVGIRFKAQRDKRIALRAIDEGNLRHPVWNTGRWAAQNVPMGSFSNAFEKRLVPLREAVDHEVSEALKEISREVNQ